jgi:hypothetical protein
MKEISQKLEAIKNKNVEGNYQSLRDIDEEIARVQYYIVKAIDGGYSSWSHDSLKQFFIDQQDNFNANSRWIRKKALNFVIELFLDSLVQEGSINKSLEYISHDRIEELKSVVSSKFDLAKLIQYCNEINSSFSNKNYISVSLLIRALINHIPPIFGNYNSFNQVIAQYGSKSVKDNFSILNENLRSISDFYNHDLIKKKESLPTPIQLSFQSNLDFLLQEIIRTIK